MSLAPDTDLSPELAAWIGRRSQRTDTITQRLAQSFRATLAPHLAAQAGAPLGIFWCLAPDIVEPHELGRDGHPRTGLFLPATAYPRRMWAGGELTFHGAFAVGDTVTKTSTIADIVFKTGKTGKLVFLTVRHEYHVGDRLVLAERQDIVYSDPAATNAVRGPPAAHSAHDVIGHWTVALDPILLFRYSALTFNGHRIHYDQPYAAEIEGYDGLVVHGPLQASLLLNLAVETTGRIPQLFRYRGQAPLICRGSARLEVMRNEAAGFSLRLLDHSGTMTMVAEAEVL